MVEVNPIPFFGTLNTFIDGRSPNKLQITKLTPFKSRKKIIEVLKIMLLQYNKNPTKLDDMVLFNSITIFENNI